MTSDAAAFRRAVIVIAALSVAGVAIELAVERHWGSVTRLIPWATLVAAVAGIALAASVPSRRRVVAVRVIATVVLLSGLIGVVLHVNENHDAEPLDAKFGERWATTPEVERWWIAISKTVGPAPPFAPLALCEIALLLGAATMGGAAKPARTTY